MTPTAEVVRGEGILVERTIRLPTDDLKDWLLEERAGTCRDSSVPIWDMLWIDMITTPWERDPRRAAQPPAHRRGGATRVRSSPGSGRRVRPALIENGLGPERESFSLVTLLVPNI